MPPKSQRCPVLRLLLPLIAGYTFAEHAYSAPFWPALLVGLAFTAAAVTLVYRRPEHNMAWIACLSGGAFCLAAAYYEHRKGYLDAWEKLPPREVELEYHVERIFASPFENRVSGLGRIVRAPSHLGELEGRRLHFFFPLDPEEPIPARSTRLRARGVLEALKTDPSSDGFHDYLLRSGVQFRFGRGPPPEKSRPARAFFRFCRERRDTFAKHLRSGSDDNPEAAYVRVHVAMLLGKRQALEPAQQSAFMETGTLHLFAISGLHIGVIAFGLHTVLTILRVRRLPTLIAGLATLLLYVEVTGGTPSAVRAFIMVAFLWSSFLFARPANPLAALGCSALCVLLLFPYQLWNAGFQLSYTVVAAILMLGMPLAEYWQQTFRPFSGLPRDRLGRIHLMTETGVRFFLVTLAVSLSATLASSPLSIHYFNVFAPGAVLLNVILVTVASLVISAGMLALFFGHLGLVPLAVLFNHAAWLVIVFMETAVAAWRHVPAQFWQAEYRAGFWTGLTVAALLGSVLLYSERAGRPGWINAVTPFLVFTLLLLAGVRLTFTE